MFSPFIYNMSCKLGKYKDSQYKFTYWGILTGIPLLGPVKKKKLTESDVGRGKQEGKTTTPGDFQVPG